MNLGSSIPPALDSAARTSIRALLCLIVCFFLLKGPAVALASGPTLTPANPSVTPGNSITLTSSTPVTWSLSGVGTLSNQTSTSVTYTAPSSVVAQNQLLGCPVLPNDTVFNTPINNLPLDPNSSAMIAAQSSALLSIQPSWGTSYADNSTPTRTLTAFYSVATYPNFAFPAQGPNLKRESGDYVGTFQFASAPDHHVMTVRHTDCTFYESYDDYLNGYVRTCNDGVTPNCNVQSATAYSSSTYNFNPNAWGTDAAGLLLAPLVWHVDEIKNGSINHAVRFTEGLGGILYGAVRWPASNTAGGCSVCPNAMPMGTRLRLKASYNISSFNAPAQVMLTALQKYGMILADTGSNNAIQTSTDVWDDPTVVTGLSQIAAAGIALSNFEVVDESSLQFAANSYTVCPYNQTCLGAANTFEQPMSQAMITATASSGSTSTPIALVGVGIGLGVPPVLPIKAGSYSFQIPYWVNNSTNQSVNWTLVSGVGSVTAGGLYTPPATTSSTASTTPVVLKGTSAADPNISVSLYLNVLPPGTSPTGSIRIDSGAIASTTDGNGNVWLPDTGPEGNSVNVTSDYPNWTTSNALRMIYQSAAISYTNDLRYTLAVPNGNYKVHLLFGIPYNGCSNPCGYYADYYGEDIHTYNPQVLETQGIIRSHYFDFGAPGGYVFATPLDIYIPAKVTNNILSIGVDDLAPDVGPNYTPAHSNKYNIVNGVEILPDTSAPHWTIDTQQQTTITNGQTLLPFYVIDWYTGVNDPVWTIISGPPGASLSGSTLSLAAGSTLNGQPIVVKASDGTYSATATIYTTGASRTALGILAPPPVVNHFGYKRAITLSHTQVNGAQTNFPVEVSLTDSTLSTVANGGHVQQASGYDIVLTSDAAGANRLSWEVEKYDPVGGTWIAHVKIPTLSNTADTVIYAFYGNPAITTNQSTPSAVWDSNYTGVYHFATVTTSTTPDSTSNNNAAVSNNNVTLAGNGEIGSAAQFGSGGSAYHMVLPAAVLNSSSGTLSAWLNPSIAMVSGQTFATGGQLDSPKAFHFLEWSSYYNGSLFGWNGGSTDYTVNIPNTTLSLPVNTWSHVVYTWNQATNTQVVYLNGVAVDTVSTAFTPYTPVSNFFLGTDPANPSYSFGGLMDEVRFSKTNRSAGWVATEYANQNSASTFVTWGAESGN
jgi:hypothetical protein